MVLDQLILNDPLNDLGKLNDLGEVLQQPITQRIL